MSLIAPTVATLFEREPPQWGLRGDPGLWNELEALFRDTPLPPSFSGLLHLLEEAWLTQTGQPLTRSAPVYVKRLNQGGMSGGYVDPKTWATKLFPLILSRYAAITFAAQGGTEA